MSNGNSETHHSSPRTRPTFVNVADPTRKHQEVTGICPEITLDVGYAESSVRYGGSRQKSMKCGVLSTISTDRVFWHSNAEI